MVSDIKDLARSGNLGFNWVRRSANKAAHAIAALAKNRKLPLNWVSVIPNYLLTIFNSDAL